MAKPLDPQQLTAPLRQQAEQHLSNGSAQLSTDFIASTDALGVLYRLSGAANTASDGLKLLHELQIHQVELDLQLEQLQNNEREFNHELSCYQQFFKMNPVACLILTPEGIITDCNAAANLLFEQLATPLSGQSLLSLLSATCRPMLSAALSRLQRNQQSTSLIVSTAGSASAAGATNLRLAISLSPDHQAILIMLT